MYKTVHEINKEVLKLREERNYNFEHISQFIIPRANTVYYDKESAFYLGSKVLYLIPSEIKKMVIFLVLRKP